MKKRKERRGLAFRVDIEFMNKIFGFLKRRKYKLIPKDAQIHAIKNYDAAWDGYTMIIASKEFPIVQEGCTCNPGCITIREEEGIIELGEIKEIDD